MPALAPIVEKLPMDWVILGLFGVIVTIITLRAGTQYAVAFSLAAPLTLFVYNALPWTAFIGQYSSQLVIPSLQASAVGVILLALCVLIYRMMPRNLLTGSFPIQAIIAGFAAAVILAVVLLQFPAITTFVPLSPLMHTIFGPSYNLFWLLAAYLALAFARK